jgi:hypothetical protein
MATGAGKTTVMGMLAASSILNKVNDRRDGRFSDVVLIVCPNVTIRDRLQELDPHRDDASLYITPADFEKERLFGRIEVMREERDETGNLRRARILDVEYFESDTAWLQRVLGDAAGKQNVLVMNDEAHHAYRIRPAKGDRDEDDDDCDVQEATVWVDGETSRDVREVNKSHVNRVVLDTRQWEQSAAFHLDAHPQVEAFVKNWRLGFGMPYLADERMRTCEPDFIVRCASRPNAHLVLETKMARDEHKEAKRAAALRWCAAVTASGQFGNWKYEMVSRPEGVRTAVDRFAAGA